MPDIRLEVENAQEQKPQVPPDRIIITVGDVKITAATFDQLIDTLQPQYQVIARGNGRKQFADNIVQLLTLSQEAQRLKLTDGELYKTRVFFQTQNLAASAFVEQLNKQVKTSDADLHKYYDEHKAEFEQVHARHILIRFQGSAVPVRPGVKDLSDAEALAKTKELIAKIKGGADFAELAKAESDDTGSGANGGDLNFFRHGQMVPSFEEAAFAMKVGETSEPVKSQFGYHIIQVLGIKSFDDVKPEIESKVKPQAAQQALAKATEDLEKAHPPVFDPEFFGPAKPADKPAADKAVAPATDKK